MEVLETAVGAVFASTRFSLVRVSIRDLVADGKSLVRNSGVGGGGQNLILISPIFRKDSKAQRCKWGAYCGTTWRCTACSDKVSEVQITRDTLEGVPSQGVAATPLRHPRNCGKSREGGVAALWSATGGRGWRLRH